MPTSTVSNVSKKIGKLLEMTDQGQLVLPEIQRDFVWMRKSIKLLIDSLYRGLPIGHMLVWKALMAVQAKSFDKRSLKRGVRIDGFYGYLLDGQQRLTALSHLRDGDEEYPLMFNIWPDRLSDGEEALYWRGKHESDNPWSVPIEEVLAEDFNLTERLNAIKADEWFKPEHEEGVRRDLASLHGILNYEVGVTEFEADDYRLATELFVRFNSTGRKLRRSDLSIAELAIHVPGLASKQIRSAQNRWKQFRFTMPFLVQCLLAVHTGRFRLTDPENFWASADPKEVSKSWEKTERAIAKLVEFLTGSVHWNSASLIPSFNALIPLVVVPSSLTPAPEIVPPPILKVTEPSTEKPYAVVVDDNSHYKRVSTEPGAAHLPLPRRCRLPAAGAVDSAIVTATDHTISSARTDHELT